MEIGPIGEIQAKSKFQRRRITEGVIAAQMYLTGLTPTIAQLPIGRTGERQAQITRLGVQYMLERGWLKKVDAPVEVHTGRRRARVVRIPRVLPSRRAPDQGQH